MSHRDGYLDDLPSGPGDVPGVAVRFDAVCAAFRNHLAVIDTTGEESYAALGERSARLATVLYRMGLERGERCAIMVPRSRDTLALILAILRLGAVYVPLDPAYPRAQLDFIVADCLPKLIIAEAAALASVGDLNGAAGRSGGSRGIVGGGRSRCCSRRPVATTLPTSCTPPARPANPRAWSCRTARFCAWCMARPSLTCRRRRGSSTWLPSPSMQVRWRSGGRC